MTDLSPALRKHFSSKAEAARLLEKYLSVDAAGRPRYTGRMFDPSVLPDEDPERFTPADLVAVSMLAIRLPSRTAVELLSEPFATKASELLAAIGPDRNLWSAPKTAIAVESPADLLWRELMDLTDVGWVTANKLLARKRPKLIPVYDSVVRDALKPGRGSFWPELREALQDSGFRDRILDVQRRVPTARQLSLLRVIDIVVWMHNHGDSQAEA